MVRCAADSIAAGFADGRIGGILLVGGRSGAFAPRTSGHLDVKRGLGLIRGEEGEKRLKIHVPTTRSSFLRAQVAIIHYVQLSERKQKYDSFITLF